jgi:hypothetical protein
MYLDLFLGEVGMSSQNRDDLPDPVTPAKAGVQYGVQCGIGSHPWMPAFAGMTRSF